MRQARIDRGERAGLTTDEGAELTRLRREVAQLTNQGWYYWRPFDELTGGSRRFSRPRV